VDIELTPLNALRLTRFNSLGNRTGSVKGCQTELSELHIKNEGTNNCDSELKSWVSN